MNTNTKDSLGMTQVPVRTLGRMHDRMAELARENERLLDCLRSTAVTVKGVTNYIEAGEPVPE